MSNILTLSISELVSKLKSGNISSVELCSAYIDRYDKFEKDVKAWAYFDKKLLLEKATEADENRKAGKPLGQLHGLPIGIKDIFNGIVVESHKYFFFTGPKFNIRNTSKELAISQIGPLGICSICIFNF